MSRSIQTAANKLKQSKLLKNAAPKIKQILDAHKPYMQILPQEIKDMLPPSKTTQKASILIPIIHVVDTQDENSAQIPSILFTTRAKHLKQHASQISFPGGHVDEEDGNCLIRAAIRETREELSPPPNTLKNESIEYGYDFENNVEILGRTGTIPSMKLIPVTPIVGMFQHEFTKEQIQKFFPGNESEVEHVFTVPIDELIRMEERESLNRLGMTAAYYNTKHGKIWGLTAVVLEPILKYVLKPVFLDTVEDMKGKL
ncbi:hypothetical protein CTEN210_00306 [Chaetoceros tenuissimus]|uniref:Nudix hydrolase domain-containing protein n=1 Tax=Chaetoceros tenuissimus TaxID=426638 RepID=A0AAD3GYU6_9STRA|nr:hypothetical protein CTEN210_00306 [Chaetoceros tenuissimus]